METDVLACLGLIVNGIIAKNIGAVLNPPPPASPFPPPVPLGAVPEEDDNVVELVDSAISFKVP